MDLGETSSGEELAVPPETPSRNRLVRDSALVPEFFWCMSCFRSQMNKYCKEIEKYDGALSTLEVVCEYDGLASKRCAGCVKKNAICHSVSFLLYFVAVSVANRGHQIDKIMFGDQMDLAKVLEWSSVFWNCDESLEPHLSQPAIKAVSVAVLELAKNLEAMVKAHRAEHALPDVKKAEKVRIFLVSWPFR
jgi:hypothetical protein